MDKAWTRREFGVLLGGMLMSVGARPRAQSRDAMLAIRAFHLMELATTIA